MKNANSLIDAMRPQNLMDQGARLRKISGRSFYKNYHDKFVDCKCPACGNIGEFCFEKFGFTHRKCENCKTIFTTPRPTDDLLLKFYNNYKAPKLWTKILISTDSNRKTIQYEPRAKKIISILKDHIHNTPELAVDLGAGSGAFALALKKQNYFKKVLALDFSKDCVDKCKSLGLDAKRGSVDILKPNSVDLITMNDLIEHLFDPKNFLEKCFNALKTNGFMTIACPNGEGFDFKIMKEHTVNIHPPEHLQYFNPGSIEILLVRVGFEIVLVETPGILDVQIIEREMKKGNCNLKKKNEFINFLLTECNENVKQSFQVFLTANRLSSHMLVLARK